MLPSLCNIAVASIQTHFLSVSVPCTTSAESSNQTRLRSLAPSLCCFWTCVLCVERTAKDWAKEASAWTVSGTGDWVRQTLGPGGNAFPPKARRGYRCIVPMCSFVYAQNGLLTIMVGNLTDKIYHTHTQTKFQQCKKKIIRMHKNLMNKRPLLRLSLRFTPQCSAVSIPLVNIQ